MAYAPQGVIKADDDNDDDDGVLKLMHNFLLLNHSRGK